MVRYGMSTDSLVGMLEELVALRKFKEEAAPELEELRAETSRQRLRIRDLREKNKALEKKANILSAGDEEALYQLNAEIQFKRNLKGDRTLTIRSGGRTVARYHTDSGGSVLKQAVSEARLRLV